MTWITTDEFKADFAVAKRATDPQVQMALDAAEDELIELVGSDAVTDALLASPTDAARAAKLARGHKFLAVASFLLNVRNVKKEQDVGSPGGHANITNEYWTPKEIAEMAEQWRAMAMRALGRYLLVDVSGDSYGAVVEYSNSTVAACGPCASGSAFVEEIVSVPR
jgi:hypothetical protein